MGRYDYMNIKVPEGKRPEEYHYTQRRADILQNHILGSDPPTPWSVNQSELAKRYGVSQPQISEDINNHLKPYLKDHLTEHAEVDTHAFIKDIAETIREDAHEMRMAGDYDKASAAEKRALSAIHEWWEWMFSTGQKDQAPDKMEVDARMEVEKRERKVYMNVDPTQLPGVDRSQMVGMATGEDLDGEGEETDLADGAEIEVE